MDFQQQKQELEKIVKMLIKRDMELSLLEESLEKQIKQRTAELRESEERYRVIFEKAGDAIFIETLDGKIIDVNSKACELLGYSKEELTSLEVKDIVPPETREMLPRIVEQIKTGFFHAETVNITKEGKAVPVDITAVLLEIKAAKRVVAFVRDISERKKAEDQLREKMKELEEFHDLAVGRELKMVELEKEIERLKGRP